MRSCPIQRGFITKIGFLKFFKVLNKFLIPFVAYWRRFDINFLFKKYFCRLLYHFFLTVKSFHLRQNNSSGSLSAKLLFSLVVAAMMLGFSFNHSQFKSICSSSFWKYKNLVKLKSPHRFHEKNLNLLGLCDWVLC